MSSRNSKNTRGLKTVPNDTSEVTFTNLRTGFSVSWQINHNNTITIRRLLRAFLTDWLLCTSLKAVHFNCKGDKSRKKTASGISNAVSVLIYVRILSGSFAFLGSKSYSLPIQFFKHRLLCTSIIIKVIKFPSASRQLSCKNITESIPWA